MRPAGRGEEVRQRTMIIRKLELAASAESLREMSAFYRRVLNLPVRDESSSSFRVVAGPSSIVFREAAGGLRPCYHVAFDIPENQMEEAVRWIAPNARLKRHEGAEIVHFRDWNAHSIYFDDPAGNLLELIARHNVDNASTAPFSGASLLRVSEIGLPVGDVAGTLDRLATQGIAPWNRYTDDFAAAGDEQGLFIVVRTGRIWFMSDKEAYPYEATIVTDHGNIRCVTGEGNPDVGKPAAR